MLTVFCKLLIESHSDILKEYPTVWDIDMANSCIVCRFGRKSSDTDIGSLEKTAFED